VNKQLLLLTQTKLVKYLLLIFVFAQYFMSFFYFQEDVQRKFEDYTHLCAGFKVCDVLYQFICNCGVIDW